MFTTNHLTKLDNAHSLMLDMVDQGELSAVLATIVSVLSTVPELEIGRLNTNYLQQAILNLNIVSDTCQRKELAEEEVFDSDALGEPSPEDWNLADVALNDEVNYD